MNITIGDLFSDPDPKRDHVYGPIEGRCCHATSQNEFFCERDPGHGGDHVYYDGDGDPYCWWTDDNEYFGSRSSLNKKDPNYDTPVTSGPKRLRRPAKLV